MLYQFLLYSKVCVCVSLLWISFPFRSLQSTEQFPVLCVLISYLFYQQWFLAQVLAVRTTAYGCFCITHSRLFYCLSVSQKFVFLGSLLQYQLSEVSTSEKLITTEMQIVTREFNALFFRIKDGLGGLQTEGSPSSSPLFC